MAVTARGHGHGRSVATSRPSPIGRIAVSNAGSAETRAQNSRSASLPSPGRDGRAPDVRPLHRTLSATTTAPGASRSITAVEVGQVLVLERVDEDHVERPGELGRRAGERLERRRVDDGDSVVRQAGLAPERPRPVGPRRGRDRSSRSCRRWAVPAPSTASSSRSPSRSRGRAAGSRRVPPSIRPLSRLRIGMRSGPSAAASISSEHRVRRPAGRLDPVEIRRGRRPAAVRLAIASSLRSVAAVRRGGPRRSTARRRGSCRRRSCRR